MGVYNGTADRRLTIAVWMELLQLMILQEDLWSLDGDKTEISFLLFASHHFILYEILCEISQMKNVSS